MYFMRKLVSLLFLSSIFNGLFAQNQQPFQYHPKNVRQLLNRSNNSEPNNSDILLDDQKAADTARFIASTNNARIYALPQDKMPCLKPDSNYAGQIPVKNDLSFRNVLIRRKGKTPGHILIPPSGPATVQQMPNAYKMNAIVFEKTN
jgi:hypothetical protein